MAEPVVIAVNHSPVLDEPESAKKKNDAGSKSPGEVYLLNHYHWTL
jgi:hypothetical protein